MHYKILSGSVPIETHESPSAAYRAMLVLTAHERVHGRTPNLRVDPPVDMDPSVIEGLPDWVKEVLFP